MTTVLILTGILIVFAIWVARNDKVLQQQREEYRKAQEAERGCYHGITRHDPDWMV